jgi:hypothetical protein
MAEANCPTLLPIPLGSPASACMLQACMSEPIAPSDEPADLPPQEEAGRRARHTPAEAEAFRIAKANAARVRAEQEQRTRRLRHLMRKTPRISG